MDYDFLEKRFYYSVDDIENGEIIAKILLDAFHEVKEYRDYDILVAFNFLRCVCDIAEADDGDDGLLMIAKQLENTAHAIRQRLQRGDLPAPSNHSAPNKLNEDEDA